MHRIEIVSNFLEEDDAKLYVKEADHPSAIEPFPEYYKERFGGTALQYNENTRYLNKKYGRKAAEYVKKIYGFKRPVYVYKVFMNHTTEIGYTGGLHTDSVNPEPWIEWSVVAYPENNFEGGKLHFPNQEFVYDPVPLEAVFFPSAGHEYIHGISEMTAGERFSIVICLTSLPWHADQDMLEPEDDMEWIPNIYNLKEDN